jgi:hypothetical protein
MNDLYEGGWLTAPYLNPASTSFIRVMVAPSRLPAVVNELHFAP